MNGCIVCGGLGSVVAFGVEPIVMQCPECAGLAITPASAEDELVGVEVAPGRFFAMSRPTAMQLELGAA